MSGGSYDYAYFKINELAEQIRLRNDPRRIAFVEILNLAAKAAKAVEWEDSGDTGKEQTDKALDELFAALGSDAKVVAKAHSYDKLVTVIQNMLGIDV